MVFLGAKGCDWFKPPRTQHELYGIGWSVEFPLAANAKQTLGIVMGLQPPFHYLRSDSMEAMKWER
jgi:hypothetical protein